MVQEDIEVFCVEDAVGIDVAEEVTVGRFDRGEDVFEQDFDVKLIDLAIGVQIEP